MQGIKVVRTFLPIALFVKQLVKGDNLFDGLSSRQIIQGDIHEGCGDGSCRLRIHMQRQLTLDELNRGFAQRMN
jgi:hypothetical protein